MKTTQTSESIINYFFDSLVDSTTMLQKFVVKFEKAVNNHYKAKKRVDFESRHKSRTFSIGLKIEEHAASVHTRNVYEKFLKELALVRHFTKEKIWENSSQCQYHLLVANILNLWKYYVGSF